MDSLTDNTTSSLHTFYGVVAGFATGLRMHYRKNSETPHLRIAGSPDNTLNYIPVDVAVRWMMDIREADVPLNNQTYHIVGPNNVNSGEVMQLLGDIMGFTFEFVADAPDKTANVLERIYYSKVNDLYYPYMTKATPVLRTDNTTRDLGGDYVATHVPLINMDHFRL